LLHPVLPVRYFGCPGAEDGKFDTPEEKAQKAVTRAEKNSRFAMALIPTLLDTSVNNYETIMLAHHPIIHLLFSFFKIHYFPSI